MKFCQAYGCSNAATCHDVLCLRHYVMTKESMRLQAISCRRAMEEFGASEEMQSIYAEVLEVLVNDVNHNLTPPATSEGGEG